MISLRAVTKRFSSFREIPGPKYTRFNFNYGPYAYHIDYKGPSGLEEKDNADPVKLSSLEKDGRVWYKHERAQKISDIVDVYTSYDEESYQKARDMVTNDFKQTSLSATPSINVNSEAKERFLWSEYAEELHPAFGSWFGRTLLYILQGVESNLDLAQSKMFYRDVQEPFHITKYRVPGDHLMSMDQYKDSLIDFYSDVIKRSEMPPICTPRKDISTPLPHSDNLYYHLDGSNLIMTDVSQSFVHENRPVYVRERITGKLRYAEWDERSRRIQAQYPTKHRSMDIPVSVDTDHPDNSEIIDTFLSEHGWKGAVQLLETALACFDINDGRYCRLRNNVNAKLVAKGLFDHLYATRHGGQFILYVLENGHAEEYIEHLCSARRGALLAQELRTFIVLMEKNEQKNFQVDEKIVVENTFERIFIKKNFTSPLVDRLLDSPKLATRLEESLVFENRYLLNEFPDYREHLMV